MQPSIDGLEWVFKEPDSPDDRFFVALRKLQAEHNREIVRAINAGNATFHTNASGEPVVIFPSRQDWILFRQMLSRHCGERVEFFKMNQT